MNLHIPNSYKVKDIQEIRKAVASYYFSGKLDRARSEKSYVHEWAAHNWLYEKGIFIYHTKDVDLNSDEPWYRRLAYFLIYLIY